MVNFRMNGFYAAEIVNKQVFLKVWGQSCGFCCFFFFNRHFYYTNNAYF